MDATQVKSIAGFYDVLGKRKNQVLVAGVPISPALRGMSGFTRNYWKRWASKMAHHRDRMFTVSSDAWPLATKRPCCNAISISHENLDMEKMNALIADWHKAAQ
jgi:hypothetical protein